MLRAYGPDCDGRTLNAEIEKIPDEATWIDLEEPTKEEERLVERCIGVNVPTQAEMAEIEPSSRLYERNGALYMTISALRGVDEAHPTTTPIGFVLAQNRLVTIRYATPKPVRTFENHARREPDLVRDGPTALIRLLDAIIDPAMEMPERRVDVGRKRIAEKVVFGVVPAGREVRRGARGGVAGREANLDGAPRLLGERDGEHRSRALRDAHVLDRQHSRLGRRLGRDGEEQHDQHRPQPAHGATVRRWGDAVQESGPCTLLRS